MHPFTYECSKLPCSSTYIRLIELEPSRNGSVDNHSATQSLPLFRCQIRSVSLESRPSFTALSYTWGNPDRTRPIVLSNLEFLTTESLAIALLHIQDPVKPITLWIDQICINQEDDIEKSAQVPLMNKIYSQAEEVLVWLGPADETSDTLMDVWQKVGAAAQKWGLESYLTKEQFPELAQIMTKSDPTHRKTIEFHEMCKTQGEDFDLEAVKVWYQRPWFWRVWIVQEFCLARQAVVVCGHKRVPADLLILARLIYHFYLSNVALTMVEDRTPSEQSRIAQAVDYGKHTDALFAARKRRRRFERKDESEPGTGDTLFQLLQRFYVDFSFQATEPRDKIFGLSALATDTRKLAIMPDYSSSTVEQIYTRVARAIIQDGELDLLTLSQFPKNLTSLPTWVPDWCGSIQPSFASLGISSPGEPAPLFMKSGSEHPLLLSTGNDEELLRVGGYHIDEIEEVRESWTPEPRNRALYLKYLSQVQSLCEISASKDCPIYDSLERRAESFWRIPIGDIEESATLDLCRATPEFYKGYWKLVHDYEAIVGNVNFSTLAECKAYYAQCDEDEPMSRRYKSRMNAMGNKRPYLSKQGFVGMGPVTTTPGDVVVAFIGANVPFMLRPTEQGRFAFLGEAYCDGVMNRELSKTEAIRYFDLE